VPASRAAEQGLSKRGPAPAAAFEAGDVRISRFSFRRPPGIRSRCLVGSKRSRLRRGGPTPAQDPRKSQERGVLDPAQLGAGAPARHLPLPLPADPLRPARFATAMAGSLDRLWTRLRSSSRDPDFRRRCWILPPALPGAPAATHQRASGEALPEGWPSAAGGIPGSDSRALGLAATSARPWTSTSSIWLLN